MQPMKQKNLPDVCEEIIKTDCRIYRGNQNIPCCPLYNGIKGHCKYEGIPEDKVQFTSKLGLYISERYYVKCHKDK